MTKPPFFDLISRQLDLLLDKRSGLQKEIDEIDARLTEVGKTLGLDIDEIIATASQRLPKRSAERREGTMTQCIRDILSNAQQGVTRPELKELVRTSDEKFADMLRRNENGFYNAVKRGIDRQEIREIDGVLYDFNRAPEEDGTSSVDDATLFTTIDKKTATVQ